MDVRPPEIDFLSNVEDSRRWQHVALRSDDIVIVTPPKCGTTWMQGIVASLLWPDGDAPDERPWVDFRLGPVEELVTSLDGVAYRRYIKSHCPLSALPLGSEVRYVLVYRDPVDALVSWGNHRATMRPLVVQALNEAAAADGVPPLAERFEGNYDDLFDEWTRFWSPPRHLAASWKFRHEPNVELFHYADMHDDLPGQMRRLADFLGIPIDERRFDEQVARCGIAEMREARRGSTIDEFFDGGVDAFFHRGGNGRGRRLLSDAQIERVERHTADLLDPEPARWVTAGGMLD